MKWISLLFTLFILVLIMWTKTGNMPHALEKIYDFPNGEKMEHERSIDLGMKCNFFESIASKLLEIIYQGEQRPCQCSSLSAMNVKVNLKT